MNNYFKFLKSGFYLLCTLVFSCNPSLGGEKVEEGWRYHANFKINLRFGDEASQIAEIDLEPTHQTMAALVKEAEELAKTFPDTTSKYLSLLRFSPIIMEHGSIRIGNSVSLTDAIFSDRYVPGMPAYEIVFASGFYPLDKKSTLQKFVKPLSLITYENGEKKNIFAVFPPYNIEKKPDEVCDFPIKLLQRDHIDFTLFHRNLHFRYPEDGSQTCFQPGNYLRLYEVHGATKTRFLDRESDIDFELSSLKNMLIQSESSVVITKKIDELRATSQSFNNAPGANSYTCAEQTGLDFIQDVRVIHYLQESLNLKNDNVIGVIANTHCTHTPCSSCSSSLARESAEGGALRKIGIFFRNLEPSISDAQEIRKPVLTFCSCACHYVRSQSMIPYNETNYLQDASVVELDSGAISFDGPFSLPYPIDISHSEDYVFPHMPVVLMQYQPTGGYQIDVRHYKHFIQC